MRTVLSLSLSTLALSLSLAACAADEGREFLEEEDVLPDELDDGKADSLTAPTEYGELLFGQTAFVTIDPTQRVRNASHTFVLTGSARVLTEAWRAPSALGEDDLPAVALYLYKQTSGSRWTRVARQTTGGTSYVGTDNELGSGTYRVIVRGLKSDTATNIYLQTACVGEGCPATTCTFGSPGDDLARLSAAYVVATAQLEIDPATYQGGDLDEGFLRRAVAQTTGLARDAALAEVVAKLHGTIGRATISDAAGRVFLAYQFDLAEGTRTVIFDITALAAEHLYTPAEQWPNTPTTGDSSALVASFGGAGQTCTTAPPVCLASADASRIQDLAEHRARWESAAQIPAALTTLASSAALYTTGKSIEESFADGIREIYHSRERAMLDGTLAPVYHVDHIALHTNDGSIASVAFVDDLPAYKLLDGAAYHCSVYVPAQNLLP